METNEELFDEFSENSDSNDEVQEEPVVCDVEEKQPKPEYTVDQLTELIAALKKIIFLDKFKESDWNDDCDKIVQTWFLDTNHLMLTIYFSSTDQLTANLIFPVEPVFELMYFLREPNHIFTIDDFHDCITFGRLDNDVDETLLLLMDKMYAPYFLHKTDWSETNRSQFLIAMNSFLANMTALHYKISGLTVLYVPGEGINEKHEQSVQDEEFIMRLELIAEHWIVQMRVCLFDREQIVPYELLCPSDEYDFWVYRCETLLSLAYQVKHKDFLRIYTILEKSHSIFIKPLKELFNTIDDEIEQAQDNINYLSLLLDPCDEISNASSPAEIPLKLAKIINIIRFIWLNSKHYKNLDAITKLYRYVGNQIIRFCQSKIQVEHIFDGNANTQIKLANLSMDCCLYYKVIYNKISKQHEHWQLDESLIFNHIDSFIQRLNDFMEVCGAIVTFKQKPNAELEFGGDRGDDFQKTCKRIEEHFAQGLKQIETHSKSILNLSDETWKICIENFREMIQRLEEIIGNMIMNVFVNVHNVDDGIYALACFYRFSDRIELQKKFERKVIVTWNLLGNEITMTNDQLVEEYNDYMAHLPTIAGRGNHLKLNRTRIIRLRTLFECNNWLPESIDTENILSNYNVMVVKMEKSIQHLFDEWIQSFGVETSTLNRLILKRSLTHTGLFECNIDQIIFTIFNEAYFFKMLGFGFPVHVNQFYIKELFIRSIYDGVINMILSYNQILLSFSEFERKLLRPLMQTSDKCIAQGALKLIWANDNLDIYISDCNKNIRDLNDFVSVYRQTNAAIVSNCERMCQINIVQIENDRPRQLDDVEIAIRQHIDEQMKLLRKEYDAIVELISDLNEELSIYMDTIKDQWIEYILKFDDLIEEAIKISARRSLQLVYASLHGNGVLNPDPLFYVVIDIQENEMVQDPDPQRIQASFESIFELLLESISKLPRLVDSFGLQPTKKSINYTEIIAIDAECLSWRTKIQEEIITNERNMQLYREKWLQYAYVWQSNKIETIEQFACNEDAIAENCDNKVQEHIELANQIAVRELYSKVHFMLVDATKIRKKIRIDIEEWKYFYLNALKQKTDKKLIEFFVYVEMNGEKIAQTPKSVDELQKCCTFYDQLTGEIDRCKCILNELHDQFNVLSKYGVSIDDELNERKACLHQRWNDYLRKLNDADEMLNNAKDGFKLTLESKRKTPDFF